MRNKSFGERIADILIEDGLLLPAQLDEAVALQKQQGGRLLKILTDKQFVSDQDMAFSMGRCLSTPPVNLPKLRVPEEILNLIPREMAKAHKLVPIARLDTKLFVAMADPTNVLAVDDLKRRVQMEIVPMIATERAVAETLSGVHNTGTQMSEVLKQVAEEWKQPFQREYTERTVSQAFEKLLGLRADIEKALEKVAPKAGVEQGTHGELLARGGLYARLYRTQFVDEAEPKAAVAE
jgi:hypothetical protein